MSVRVAACLFLLLGPLALADSAPPLRTSRIFIGASTLAELAEGTLTFLHRDHVGSVVALSSGPEASGQHFLPFGASLTKAKAGPGFGGHRAEAETSLLYAGARYLQAGIGRFDQADPVVRLAGSAYAFVGNAPLRKVDPDGRRELDIDVSLVFPGEESRNPVVIYMRTDTYEKVMATGRWGAEDAAEVFVTKYKMSYDDVQEKVFQAGEHDWVGEQRRAHHGKGEMYVIIDAEGLELKPGKNKFDIVHEGPIDLHGRTLSAGTNEFSPLSKLNDVEAARLNHHTVSARYRAPLDLPQRRGRSVAVRSVGAGLLMAYPNIRDGISLWRSGERLDAIDQFLMIFSPIFIVNPAYLGHDPNSPFFAQGPKS